MEVSGNDHEIYGPGDQSNWFASSGIGNRGQTVTLNFFAKDKDEADLLAQALGIAHDIHDHKDAKYIATKQEYDDCFAGD